MKSNLLLGLALVLGGYFAPLTVQAYWGLVPVDHANMDSTAPFVRVVSKSFGITNDSRVAFSIYVLPKDKTGAQRFSGNLTVKNDAGKLIASNPIQPKPEPEVVPEAVPKSWAGKCMLFEFSVAANYLSQSEFDLNETGDLKWGTSGIALQFNLREFAATPDQWHSFAIQPPITNLNRSVDVADIKITFAHPSPTPPLPQFPSSAKLVASGEDSAQGGAFTNIVAGRISALVVTWADPKYFKGERQIQDFISELLCSTNTPTGSGHIWPWVDGIPCLVATVEHTAGKQGQWVMWRYPTLYWAYQDGNGKWWWGIWDSLKSPKPKSLNTP